MAKQKVTKKQTVAVSIGTVPQKHKVEFYDYHEVAEYLEKLHKKDFRDYAGKHSSKTMKDVPYQDFWHMIVDCNEVTNGGFIHLPDWEYYTNNATTEPWQKEIMQFFYDFLGEDYHKKMRAAW